MAEAAFLSAYQSGRVPHAFLIAGPKGIGKATLAYRVARFVLAHPDPAAREVRARPRSSSTPQNPVARRIAAQAQPDLLIIERTLNDKGVLHKQIAVEDIRRTVAFFGSTAGEGGWRIAIVDAVDELNRSGTNALLKVLEEPPQRACCCCWSAIPRRGCRRRCGRGAACFRCGRSPKPMSSTALAAATGTRPGDPQLAAAAAAADGSVARALAFLDEGALALRQQSLDLLDRLPAVDTKALHALGEALAGTDPQPLAAFVDTVNAWLSQRLDRRQPDTSTGGATCRGLAARQCGGA